MLKVLNDFKTFVLRGNVVDLAVGIVIGVAFQGVVLAFVKDLLTPLISIPGKADFASLTFEIHGSVFRYGDFINNIISFLLIAAAIFFFVVRPINALVARSRRGSQVDPTTRACPYCLSAIPVAATKCMYCTADVPSESPAVAAESSAE